MARRESIERVHARIAINLRDQRIHDLEGLIREVVPDAQKLLADLPPPFRCRKCGSTKDLQSDHIHDDPRYDTYIDGEPVSGAWKDRTMVEYLGNGGQNFCGECNRRKHWEARKAGVGESKDTEMGESNLLGITTRHAGATKRKASSRADDLIGNQMEGVSTFSRIPPPSQAHPIGFRMIPPILRPRQGVNYERGTSGEFQASGIYLPRFVYWLLPKLAEEGVVPVKRVVHQAPRHVGCSSVTARKYVADLTEHDGEGEVRAVYDGNGAPCLELTSVGRACLEYPGQVVGLASPDKLPDPILAQVAVSSHTNTDVVEF